MWQAGITGSKMRHIDLEAEQTFDRVEKSQLKRKTKTEEREKGRKREKLERRERENKWLKL